MDYNDKILDFCNVHRWHELGYLGQGLKIAVLEPRNPSEHQADSADAIKTALPLAWVDSYQVDQDEDLETIVKGGYDLLNCSFSLRPTAREIKFFADVERQGTVIFASAGNRDHGDPTNIRYPANSKSTFSVSALEYTQRNFNWFINVASYNTFGNEMDLAGFTEMKMPDGRSYSGTSCACPQALSTAGIIVQHWKTLDFSKNSMTVLLRNLFRKYCVDIHTEGKDEYTGYGYLRLPNPKPNVKYNQFGPYWTAKNPEGEVKYLHVDYGEEITREKNYTIIVDMVNPL